MKGPYFGKFDPESETRWAYTWRWLNCLQEMRGFARTGISDDDRTDAGYCIDRYSIEDECGVIVSRP